MLPDAVNNVPDDEDEAANREPQEIQVIPGAITRDDIKTARQMFYGGFFFLPMLWFICYFTYRGKIQKADCPQEMRQHVLQCRTAGIIGSIVMLIWIVFFQINLHSGASWASVIKMNFIYTEATDPAGSAA